MNVELELEAILESPIGYNTRDLIEYARKVISYHESKGDLKEAESWKQTLKRCIEG